MVTIPETQLKQLAEDAVRELAGPDARFQVAAEAGSDFYDAPACFFTIRIRKGRVFELSPSLFRIRLLQGLQGRLAGLGDERLAIIRTLVLSDWDQHADA